MKPITLIFAVTVISLIISCGQTKEKKITTADHSDTTRTFVEMKEKKRQENIKQMEEQEKLDSINHDNILNEAVKIAEQYKTQHTFKKNYVVMMPDSTYQVEVNISRGFYFLKTFSHLIIRRKDPGSVYIDIFTKTDAQFQKVLSHAQWTREYTGDTICDVNGDGLKDFVVNWYGSNGCCLKAFSNVYLQRPDKRTFSGSFEFINPTFSPKEQIIRGVCYGHPGDTQMYKYKWNKEGVDTVEYIYYEKSDKGEKTGKLIVSNNLSYSENYRVLKRLGYIPAEYRNIYGYDWFIDNLGNN